MKTDSLDATVFIGNPEPAPPLLANIERAGHVGHTVLAEKVGMERTTLTRNLRRLTRAKWVAAVPGKDVLQLCTRAEGRGRRSEL